MGEAFGVYFVLAHCKNIIEEHSLYQIPLGQEENWWVWADIYPEQHRNSARAHSVRRKKHNAKSKCVKLLDS